MVIRDKKGRTIVIKGDYNVEAYHQDRQVGTLEFGECDGHPFLGGMYVDDNYQRAGIATAMMQYAVQLHGKSFSKPKLTAVGGRDAASETYYTDDGAAFIAYCIRKGILDDTDHTEQDDFDDDYDR